MSSNISSMFNTALNNFLATGSTSGPTTDPLQAAAKSLPGGNPLRPTANTGGALTNISGFIQDIQTRTALRRAGVPVANSPLTNVPGMLNTVQMPGSVNMTAIDQSINNALSSMSGFLPMAGVNTLSIPSMGNIQLGGTSTTPTQTAAAQTATTGGLTGTQPQQGASVNIGAIDQSINQSLQNIQAQAGGSTGGISLLG